MNYLLPGVLLLRQNLHIGHYYGRTLTSEMEIPRIGPIYLLPHGWFKCISYYTTIMYVKCTL